jgi:GntR family transcriptional regulator
MVCTNLINTVIHAMPLEFQIVAGTTPIYRQLVDQVRYAVTNKLLSEGDPLPSVRSLAEYLTINPNTVARAYQQLVEEGVVESHHGKGVFIGKLDPELLKQERLRRFNQALTHFEQDIEFLQFEPREISDLVYKRFVEKRQKR